MSGDYRYTTSNGVSETPTTTTSPCAMAISPTGVPTIFGRDSADVFGFMQRINGTWVTTPLTDTGIASYQCDVVFGADGTLFYAVLTPPANNRVLRIGSYKDGIESFTDLVPPSGVYSDSSQVRMAVDARGYPVVVVSRQTSGNNYTGDTWIWKRDGINDTYQCESVGNPYQLGAVHVVGGRGYNQ